MGPGVCSSAICMDKEYTHIVLDAAGIKTSDWFCVRKGEVPSLLDLEVKIAVKLGGFPVFVKPCNAGSSVGVSKVKTSDDLEEAMMLAFQHDQKILIERAMVGKEVEVAVMGNDSPEASVQDVYKSQALAVFVQRSIASAVSYSFALSNSLELSWYFLPCFIECILLKSGI